METNWLDCLVWFVCGIVAGLGISLLVYLHLWSGVLIGGDMPFWNGTSDNATIFYPSYDVEVWD